MQAISLRRNAPDCSTPGPDLPLVAAGVFAPTAVVAVDLLVILLDVAVACPARRASMREIPDALS